MHDCGQSCRHIFQYGHGFNMNIYSGTLACVHCCPSVHCQPAMSIASVRAKASAEDLIVGSIATLSELKIVTLSPCLKYISPESYIFSSWLMHCSCRVGESGVKHSI